MRSPLPIMALVLALAACSSSSPSGSGEVSEPGPAPAATTGPATNDAATPPASDAGAADADDGGLRTNGFPAKWQDGTSCSTETAIQTWALTSDTFILRQSLCTTFEGPFMYLLVGSTKALLVDTGTGGVDLRSAVTTLLAGKNVELVVAHSHGHGDHVGGDGAFRNQAQTTVVGTGAGAVQQFFGLSGGTPAPFDLGGRIVDVLAIAGHQAAHVAFYDHATHVLLTGDTLYPGRLYIDDWNAYRQSIPRLVSFVDDGRPVSFVLGGHIELPQTGSDYAYGATKHPNEHALQLADSDLRELDAAVKALGNNPQRDVHANFVIDP